MIRSFELRAIVLLGCSVCAMAQQSRIIDDTAHNTRWVLEIDPAHPAGPAHWRQSGPIPKEVVTMASNGAVQGLSMIPAKPKILIHSGEEITVFRDSSTVKLQLEAKALESAAVGGRLRVRLKTGSVVDAVAVAEKRAELTPHLERRVP